MRFQLIKILSILSVGLPGLVSLFIWFSLGPYSPEPFSDWDEFYYLPQTRTMSWNKISHPHDVIDILINSASETFNVSLPTLSFLLDIFCPIFACLLFFKFLSLFGTERSKYAALGGTLCAILYPWLWSDIQFFFDRFIHIYPSIDPISHNKFPSLPTHRAFFTQLSWLLFPLLLLRFFTIIKDRKVTWGQSLEIGILSGLSIYSYFFLWATCGALFATTFLISYFLNRSLWSNKDLLKVIVAGVISIIVSYPGIKMLFPKGEVFAAGPNIQLIEETSGLSFSDVWFFSVFNFVLIFFILYKLKYAKSRNNELLYITVFGVLIAEFCLMNAQAALNHWLTPYHFTLWYLHPLLTGIIIFALLDGNSIAPFCCLVLILLGPKFGWQKWVEREKYGTEARELLQYVDKELPSNSVVFTIPYFLNVKDDLKYSILPYWIALLGNKTPYVRLTNYYRDRALYTKQELALNYILTGKVEMVGFCPTSPISLEGNDLLSGARTFLLMQRTVDCNIGKNWIGKPATLLPLDRPIFLILQNEELQFATTLNKRETWRSNGGRYTIYSIEM